MELQNAVRQTTQIATVEAIRFANIAGSTCFTLYTDNSYKSVVVEYADESSNSRKADSRITVEETLNEEQLRELLTEHALLEDISFVPIDTGNEALLSVRLVLRLVESNRRINVSYRTNEGCSLSSFFPEPTTRQTIPYDRAVIHAETLEVETQICLAPNIYSYHELFSILYHTVESCGISGNIFLTL